MKPGRELDTLVATKVVGWKREAIEGEMYLIAPDGAMWAESETHCLDKCLPHYSTSIEAAWEVVERLCERDYELDFTSDQGEICPWICTFNRLSDDKCFTHDSDNPAFAVCLAALKACGVDL